MNKKKSELCESCRKVKIKFFSFIMVSLISNLIFSQTFQWAKSVEVDDFYTYVRSSTVDPFGNFIYTGSFSSASLTIGNITLYQDTFGYGGVMFVVKCDPNGNVIWAKNAGGKSASGGYSCTSDRDGNIIVTGRFQGPTVSFGSTVLDSIGFLSDIFIAKYDSSGNLLWAKSEGTKSVDDAYNCTSDKFGNIFVTGTNGGYPAFIAKYTSSGSIVWTKKVAGSSFSRGLRCVSDSNGDVYFIGEFNGGTAIMNNTTFLAQGWDIFIAKLDSLGAVISFTSISGASSPTCTYAGLDKDGSLIMAGNFIGDTIFFNQNIFVTKQSTSGADMYIVKYDILRNVLWAKSFGGVKEDYIYSCSLDSNGSIFAIGAFKSESINLQINTLYNSGGNLGTYDVFFAKFDSNGNEIWATSAGGPSDDVGITCASSFNGDIYFAGSFVSHSITFGQNTLSNLNGQDLFITKISSSNANSINQLSDTKKIVIYPNPSNKNSKISISLDDNIKIGPTSTMLIYNDIGEIIFAKKIDAKLTSFDLDNFSAGRYYIKIISNDNLQYSSIFTIY